MKLNQDIFYQRLLSEKTRHTSERVIVILAIASFLLHLLLIGLVELGFVELSYESELLASPIAAIYTPFSFILVYEVYLLVYYLPKSVTTYISKQYEIITLIVIRRIFKDISKVELKGWDDVTTDLQLGYDLGATLLLFLLIYFFYRLNQTRKDNLQKENTSDDRRTRFIRIKKLISTILVPTLLILAFYSLGYWLYKSLFSGGQLVVEAQDINNIFFDDFFTILILTDVLLLLISFIYTADFWTVIRNSGFIISTILIKLSFSASGLLNPILVVAAVTFGVIILWIHNLYEKIGIPPSERNPV